MITIKNKFEVGELVYSIESVPMESTCDVCSGEGTIQCKEKTFRCPQCKGEKTISSSKFKMWRVIPEKLKIGSIKATINGTNCTLRYKASGRNRAEFNLFKTFEDAQKRCDELNFVISESN